MNGTHIEQRFTTPDPEETVVKRLAMRSSEETFALIDYTKFGQLFLISVAPSEAVAIIIERCSLEFINEFREKTTIKEVIQ